MRVVLWLLSFFYKTTNHLKMKKHYYLLIAILSVFELTAQINEVSVKSYDSPLGMQQVSMRNQRAAGSPVSIASIDTIWRDDFSDTANWTYSGGANEWSIDSSLTTNLIGQTFDSLLNSTSGGNFAIIDSDASGATGTQDATIEYTGGAIDCSSYLSVRLVFETYLRQYQETRQVLVSNDGGAVWDTIAVLTQFGTGTTSPNVYTEIVDITAFAGGQSNVKIKFRYMGSNDWFWCIDDVRIVSAPQNELGLTETYYNTINDASYKNYYTMMPLRQADSAGLNLGVTYKNGGVAAQTNSHATVSVTYNGTNVFTDTTDSVLITPNASVAVNFPKNFKPVNGMGSYRMEFIVASDSVDEIQRNNTIINNLEVSNNQYRRDNDTLTNSNWFDVSNQWEMLVKYEIYTNDTVVGISTFFPYNPSSGRGVNAGDSVSYYIYKATDLDSAISKNASYIVQQSDVNNWLTLPMPAVKLEPGIYYAGFKISNNRSSVGTNSLINAKTAPLAVLVRRDATATNDPWEYTTSFTPFVRLYTKSDDACNGVNIVIEDTVFDKSTFGAIDITITGGAPTYTYSWTGPNSFTANTKNIKDLAKQGWYYVTVTDVFGCAGNDSSLVAGSVTVKDLGFAKELKLFPNPNNGQFTLTGTDVTNGYYTFTVINTIGQALYTRELEVGNSFAFSMNVSNLKSGIYFVKIANTNGQNQVVRFVVE